MEIYSENLGHEVENWNFRIKKSQQCPFLNMGLRFSIGWLRNSEKYLGRHIKVIVPVVITKIGFAWFYFIFYLEY